MDISDLFTVDTQPASKDDLDVPAYNQKYNSILQKSEEETNEKKGKISSQTCFNCLGDHSLKDCKERKDHVVIAQNRRKFMNKQRNFPKSSRYHLDDEQRFAHFQPGRISHTLRKALGLSRRQLPRHIYNMRRLGYPPGWMQEAKISHSGISLFDSLGQEVADPADEEGEIITKGSKDTYDVGKIINYPGFNVPCSPDVVDEFEHYRSPPMAFHQSKDVMLSSLQVSPSQAYQRRRLKSTPLEPQDVSVVLHDDMDVEETEGIVSLLPNDECRFIPPLPKESQPAAPPPPLPAPESDFEGGDSRSQDSTISPEPSSPRVQSPSLSDLESRKQSLLAELEENSSSEAVKLVKTPTLGKVKSVALGTPILKATSPYSRLPSAEKFSRDICDVINFENLPDSTGKYEKMSDIIQKVRTAVAKFQSDDS